MELNVCVCSFCFFVPGGKINCKNIRICNLVSQVG